MPRTPDKGMLAPAPLRHSAKLPQHVCEATPWGRVLKAAEMRESRLLGRIPRLKLLLPYLKQDARHDWAGLPPCMPCMDQQLVRHIVLDVLDSTLPASAKQAVLEGIFGLENFSGAQQWCVVVAAKQHDGGDDASPSARDAVPRDARVVRDSRESVEKPASDFGAYEQEEGS